MYGGSMNPENAAELLALADIDGGLIGTASARTGIVRLHYRRGETGQYVKRIKSAVERFLRLEVTMKIPTTLIIMDGYGWRRRPTATRSPRRRRGARQALPDLPETALLASGEDVGLPSGQSAQRGRPHEYRRGTERRLSGPDPDIRATSKQAVSTRKQGVHRRDGRDPPNGRSLHLIGLMSPGGVHSHIDHLWAFLEMARRRGIGPVYLHCFMDGRDTLPNIGKSVIEDIVSKCRELGVGKIATVMGRFYAMDRDKRWERTERAYNAMVFGEGALEADPVRAVQNSYDDGVTDEFIEPVVVDEAGLLKPATRSSSSISVRTGPGSSHVRLSTGIFPASSAETASSRSTSSARRSTTKQCRTLPRPIRRRFCITRSARPSATWALRSCARRKPKNTPM
jgi:hypothetical protein